MTEALFKSLAVPGSADLRVGPRSRHCRPQRTNVTAPFDTNSPDLVSWVESANAPEAPFPIQNLPYGRFRRDPSDPWSIGVAVGDRILDVHGAGLFYSSEMGDWLTLSRFERQAQRQTISLALKHNNDSQGSIKPWLVPMTEVELGLRCDIRNYSDFFIGIHHAYNTGRLSRPDTPLLPNYRWVPSATTDARHPYK
jgi:fumarylacetoacetase